MRNTTFILITLLIILLCGLAVPSYREGAEDKPINCNNYNNNAVNCINNKCSYNGKTDKCFTSTDHSSSSK